MTANWEKQEGNQGVLTFDVSADEFEKALEQSFNKNVKDVEIPGFRKGKVPRKLFESRFGVESLYQDAVDIVLPDAYSKAVEEVNIEPIEQPDVDIDQIEQGKDLIFKATVNVKPEVALGEYKGLEVEEEQVGVTDEDVDQELEHQREHQAELTVKEEGTVEQGDTVVIDFEGFVDGEAFEGGQGEDYSLEIGSNQFIPGFEEKLIGASSGEETNVTLTFPEEYHAEHLAGQEAVFAVKIHDIKTKEFPEMDDEFAKDVDEEVETLDELKQKTKDNLQSQREQDAENQKRETLIEKASDNAEVEIPDAMVETELDRMIQEFEQRLQSQGMTLDMYYQFAGQSKEDLKEQMREDAQKRVKTNMVLEAIYNAEGLEVTDEDVEEQISNMASMYGTDADQLKQMLGGNIDMLKEELKSKKSIDFLAAESKSV